MLSHLPLNQISMMTSQQEIKNDNKVDVLIVGFGAVGILYGWVLEQSSKVRVTALARSNYNKVKNEGVRLESSKFGKHNWKPHRVIKDIDEVKDVNFKYIICTFKHLPDVNPTQDILGIEEPLQSVVKEACIISGAIWIGANLRDENKVVHNDLEKLVIGRFKGENRGPNHQPVLSNMSNEEGDRYVNDLATYLQLGTSQTIAVDNIQPIRWKKNLWNATFSTVSTLAGEPMSQLLLDENVQYIIPIARRTMLEILFTARAVGITEEELPASSVDEQLSITLEQYGSLLHADEKRKNEDADSAAGRAAFKPSMLIDFENSRPMELQCIVGSIVQRAREFGLETPRLDLAYSILSIKQRSFIESANQKSISDGMTEILSKRIANLKTSSRTVPSGTPLNLPPTPSFNQTMNNQNK